MEAATTSWLATAGYSGGAYPCDAPSRRTAESKIAISPFATLSRKVPQVPTLKKVVAPHRASSSMAIAVDGAPIPVDTQLIGAPLYTPV